MEEQERKIESLLARLQSERSISKIARKKADQLAQRVVELETELEIVHNQKKKAEKAAAKVLSILRDNGIEYSDEGASRTGQEEIWNSPREGIISYSETTPEQTSGEENYVEPSPKHANLCSPVEEGSEFDSGTNVDGSEADEEIDRESEQDACYQSKEEAREINKEKVKGIVLSGSVPTEPAKPADPAVKAAGQYKLLEVEHPFACIKSPSESYESQRSDGSVSCVSHGEIRPEAGATRTKAASSSRLAVKKSSSYTLTEANINEEQGQRFPKDRLDSGSTTSNRSADHSPAGRGSGPVHVQETSGAEKARGKQSVFPVGAASSPGVPKLQDISQESSESKLLLRLAASQGSTSSSSVDEVERALESLQLAKFCIQSGVEKSSSCGGVTIPENICRRRTEGSVELPLISCAGLFRLPPSVHGAGTRNKSLLPYSDLVTGPGPALGIQHSHHIFPNHRAPFSTTKMQLYRQPVASTTMSSSLSHPYAQFPGSRHPGSDEQGSNPGR